jgi:hypothetical protein
MKTTYLPRKAGDIEQNWGIYSKNVEIVEAHRFPQIDNWTPRGSWRKWNRIDLGRIPNELTFASFAFDLRRPAVSPFSFRTEQLLPLKFEIR